MNGPASRYDYQFDPAGESTAARVCRLVGRDQTVLELGCAAGAMSAVMTEQYGCKVIGIEFEGPAAESARRFCVRVEQADLDDARWADRFEQQGFDRIVAADVLEHLHEPLACARQFRRLLRPDGQLIVSVPNIAHSGVLAALLLGDFSYRETGLMDRTHVHFFTASTLCRMLARAGFIVDHLETVDTGPWHPEFSGYWERLPIEIRNTLAENPIGRAYQIIVRAHMAGETSESKTDASSGANLIGADADSANALTTQESSSGVLPTLITQQAIWLESWATALSANTEISAELEAKRAELGAQSAEFSGAQSEFKTSTAELEARLTAKERELAEAKQALATMQQSHSWKLTAPLRYLVGKLKSRP